MSALGLHVRWMRLFDPDFDPATDILDFRISRGAERDYRRGTLLELDSWLDQKAREGWTVDVNMPSSGRWNKP